MSEIAVTNPITIEALGQVMTSVGLSATLLLFFVWWLYNSQLRIAKETLDRENRVASEVERREKLLVEDFRQRHVSVVERLQALEDFSRGTMMGLVKDTGAALAANTSALQNNTLALERSATTSASVLNAVDKLARDMSTIVGQEKRNG